MKALKLVGIVIGVLVALVLLLGLIMPKHYEYERSLDMNAPKAVVFEQIDNLKNWEAWGPWKAQDPTNVTTLGEKTQGVGASFSWTSENSGEGSMMVTESTPPTFQKTHLEFKGQGGADGWFKLEDGEGGGTKTTWGMAMDIPYPFNAMTLFTGSSMKKSMYDMFDAGLASMKTIVEKQAADKTYRGYKVQETNLETRQYAAVRSVVKFADMASYFGKNYGVIGAAMKANKLEIAGAPSGLYWVYDEAKGEADMAAAMPFKAAGAASNLGKGLSVVPIGGRALVIDYFGGYEKIGDAHFAMDDYIKEKGLKQKTPVIEEYITDPMLEKDTSKWLTKVIYLVE
jgi:effector-binding domain-containing protein